MRFNFYNLLHSKGYMSRFSSTSIEDMINYNFGEAMFLSASLSIEELKNPIQQLNKIKEKWESLKVVFNDFLVIGDLGIDFVQDELKEEFPELFASTNKMYILQKIEAKGFDNLFLQINMLIENFDKIIYDSYGCYLMSNYESELRIEPLQVNLEELSFLNKYFSLFRPGNKTMTYFKDKDECYIQKLDCDGILGLKSLSEHCACRNNSCSICYYDQEAVEYLQKGNVLPSLKMVHDMDSNLVPDVSIAYSNIRSNRILSTNKCGILYSEENLGTASHIYNSLLSRPYSLLQHRIREENFEQRLTDNRTR